MQRGKCITYICHGATLKVKWDESPPKCNSRAFISFHFACLACRHLQKNHSAQTPVEVIEWQALLAPFFCPGLGTGMGSGHGHHKVLCCLMTVPVGVPTRETFPCSTQTCHLHVKAGTSLDSFPPAPLSKQLVNNFFSNVFFHLQINWWKALSVGTTRTKWHVVKAFPECCLYLQNAVHQRFLDFFFFENKCEVFLPSPELVNIRQNPSPVRLSSTQLFYISKQQPPPQTRSDCLLHFLTYISFWTLL